jgi:hypothetical protein
MLLPSEIGALFAVRTQRLAYVFAIAVLFGTSNASQGIAAPDPATVSATRLDSNRRLQRHAFAPFGKGRELLHRGNSVSLMSRPRHHPASSCLENGPIAHPCSSLRSMDHRLWHTMKNGFVFE